jgi:hypothetical protein
MAQSARLSEGVAAPRMFAPQPRNDRDANARNLDWDLARVTKANLLLVGAEQTVSSLVFAMWSLFDGPILVRRRHERLALPLASNEIGTLILHGVETLTHEEQGVLYEWLTDRASRTRVVSTAPASLLPLVQANLFSSELYYRLNTIWVDMTGR